jgi:hypothetical protein
MGIVKILGFIMRRLFILAVFSFVGSCVGIGSSAHSPGPSVSERTPPKDSCRDEDFAPAMSGTGIVELQEVYTAVLAKHAAMVAKMRPSFQNIKATKDLSLIAKDVEQIVEIYKSNPIGSLMSVLLQEFADDVDTGNAVWKIADKLGGFEDSLRRQTPSMR